MAVNPAPAPAAVPNDFPAARAASSANESTLCPNHRNASRRTLRGGSSDFTTSLAMAARASPVRRSSGARCEPSVALLHSATKASTASRRWWTSSASVRRSEEGLVLALESGRRRLSRSQCSILRTASVRSWACTAIESCSGNSAADAGPTSAPILISTWTVGTDHGGAAMRRDTINGILGRRLGWPCPSEVPHPGPKTQSHQASVPRHPSQRVPSPSTGSPHSSHAMPSSTSFAKAAAAAACWRGGTWL